MTGATLAKLDPSAERENARKAFLRCHGWDQAELVPFTSDASRRRYWRLVKNSETCLLMDMPIHREENFSGYVTIARALKEMGLSVPEILALDEAQQFALIEDFGDQTYTRLLNEGHDPAPLYERAVEAIAVMQNAPLPFREGPGLEGARGRAVPSHEPDPPPKFSGKILTPPEMGGVKTSLYSIPPYNHTALMDEALRLVDWYWPVYHQQATPAEVRAEFEALFDKAFKDLPPLPDTLVLRDFHVDNLMKLNRPGIEACGILDFQDARIGSPAYDLVSLIEDARRDIAPALAAELKASYLKARPGLDADIFTHHFAVMGAQRHARILGQFIRLWLRDNKIFYLQFLPRVARQLTESSRHPSLKPLQAWLQKNLPDMLNFAPNAAKEAEYRALINPDLMIRAGV